MGGGATRSPVRRMSVHFSHPLYLWLLPLVWAFTWWVMRDSLADLDRTRVRLAAAARYLILTVLVLALAGIQLVRPTTTLCTVFVVDVSDSIAPSQRQVALDFIRQATKKMKTGDQAAVVAFGGDALLDHAPEDREAIRDIVSIPGTSRTDIAAGLQLAMASFPQESGKQVILFSDGNENLGNAVEQAAIAISSDVRISVVPLERDTTRGEALLLRADTPSEVKQGAPFQVSVIAEALRPTEGIITLFRNNTAVEKKPVRLKAGKNVVSFDQEVPKSGLYHFRALLDVPSAQDTVPDNNVAYGYTRVQGKPKVLIVEGTPGDGAHLVRALHANDLQVDVGGPQLIPATLAECAQYDSVLFANVPAWKMSPAQMAVLRGAVRDTGMGFAMLGGEESFGAGGYFKTPVEEILPVSMDMKQQKVLPALTLVIVIDISGSMTMTENGVPKIRLAAEAAAAAVEMLQGIDQICVIGYDTDPIYTVKMTRASNKGAIISQIERLEAGGGGIMAHSSLKEAYKVIRGENTPIRHVILCADAQDTEEQEGCIDLARQMAHDKVTLSVIGFGTRHDPHVQFHQDLARAGGGTAYLAERLSNLPQIFTRDVMQAARSLLVEEPFRVRGVDTAHPATRGIGWNASPPLLGYVATSFKDNAPSARLLLASHKDDPVLAAWNIGLGRSLAFTSDATAHWGAHWLGWGDYPTFWSQSLRWTLRQGGKANFQTMLVEEHGRTTIVVEAVDANGEYRNLLDLNAHVSHVGTGGLRGLTASREVLKLEQVAPGRYEASFEARNTGTYMVAVEERDGGTVRGLDMATMVIPYSPEYQAVRTNASLLDQVATQAKGEVRPQPNDVFTRLRFGSRVLRDLWPVLLALLGLLFLCDVAVRRVLMPWDEVFALARKAIAGRLPAWGTATTATPRRHSATLGNLLNTREKVRTPKAETPTGHLREMREQAREAQPTVSTPLANEPSAAPEPEQPVVPSGTVGTLLQKKRDRKQ